MSICGGQARTLSSFLSSLKLMTPWPFVRREQAASLKNQHRFPFQRLHSRDCPDQSTCTFTSSIVLGLCSYSDLAPTDLDCSRRVQLLHAVFSSLWINWKSKICPRGLFVCFTTSFNTFNRVRSIIPDNSGQWTVIALHLHETLL